MVVGEGAGEIWPPSTIQEGLRADAIVFSYTCGTMVGPSNIFASVTKESCVFSVCLHCDGSWNVYTYTQTIPGSLLEASGI